MIIYLHHYRYAESREISQRTVIVDTLFLISFTTHLCETGFTPMLIVITKFQNKLNVYQIVFEHASKNL